MDSHIIRVFRIAGEDGIGFSNYQLGYGIMKAWLMFQQIFLKFMEFKFRHVPKLRVSRSVYVFILIFFMWEIRDLSRFA